MSCASDDLSTYKKKLKTDYFEKKVYHMENLVTKSDYRV